MTDKAATKSVVVTVTDEKLKSIRHVANELSSKGMTVTRVLPVTGVIAGACKAADIPELESVNGVLSLEEELQSSLPPSGSSVQ